MRSTGLEAALQRAWLRRGALALALWPLSMILRMLRPFRIYDGASEVHRTAIARRVFNHRLPA